MNSQANQGMRWMNQDPIGIRGGLNLYGFVENDPIDFYDPMGLSWQECLEKYKGMEAAAGAGLARGLADAGLDLAGAVEASDPALAAMNQMAVHLMKLAA